MINLKSFLNNKEYDFEQEFNAIIESCHRTIDWSVRLYFKTLKKGLPLFAEKLVKEDKYDFTHGFSSFFLNDTEVAQLTRDIEEHVNNDIISLQNKWLPNVKFKGIDLNSSFESLLEVLKEQRKTIRLSKQVENTVGKLTVKTLSGFTPPIVPKGWLANPVLVKKITGAMAVDTAKHYQYSNTLLQNHITGLLDNLEHDLKESLKYQLAVQLYNWFDHYISEQEKPEQQVVNQ